MKLRNMLLAATVLALPVAAQAQPISGLYVGAGVGGNYLADVNAKAPPVANTKLTNKGGFAGDISVGYGFGNGFRVELEGEGIDSQVNAKKPVKGGGTLYSYGAMVNGLYDINLGSPFTPYVGVGAGYQLTQLSGVNLYAPGQNPLFSANTNTKGSFAAQGIVGVAYAIPGAPGLAVTADYRFLATTSDEKFNGSYVSGTKFGNGSVKLGNQYNNTILIGLRYAFGVAPAPMAPAPMPAAVVAPAPAPARSYLVFFDWDKADLTARAQQIIAEAAQNATRVSATKIDVAGHADSSGTPAYNQTLSLRRANNVAAELVRLGVPKTEISITAYGDTKPLVPTAPGVREPQNRRVEIVLH